MLWISEGWRLLLEGNGAFFLHEIAFGDIFFFDLVELVNVFLHICLEDHEIVDEVLVVTPKVLCVSIVLDETEFFLAVVVEYDPALFSLQC